MRSFIWKTAVGIIMLFGGAMSVFSFETVQEPATKIEFPAITSFRYQGAEHVLTLTGVTVRRKYFFKIYAIAHYMEGGPQKNSQAAINAVLTDGKAKEMIIEYVRDLGGDKVQETLREGFLRNTTPAEYKEIRPLVDQLCHYFDGRMIRKKDRAIFRWLTGGTVISIFNGKEIATVHHATFARALWSIWFGEHAVVDPGTLMTQATREAGV